MNKAKDLWLGVTVKLKQIYASRIFKFFSWNLSNKYLWTLSKNLTFVLSLFTLAMKSLIFKLIKSLFVFEEFPFVFHTRVFFFFLRQVGAYGGMAAKNQSLGCQTCCS